MSRIEKRRDGWVDATIEIPGQCSAEEKPAWKEGLAVGGVIAIIFAAVVVIGIAAGLIVATIFAE